MKKSKFITLVVLVFLLLTGALLFKSNVIGAQALWNLSKHGSWLFPLVSISALVDSINPCAFSILLLTIAFLVSLGRLRSNILAIGTTYIAGIFVVYLFIGLGILQALHLFNTPHFMAKIAAWIMIGVGVINLLNSLFPTFPIKLKIPSVSHKKMAQFIEMGSLPAAFALGALVGLCEFPCTGGPYLLVLGLLHDKATTLRGLWYLLWYNALFILPLVMMLFLASDRAVLSQIETWKKRNMGMVKLVSGIIMIGLGAGILMI